MSPERLERTKLLLGDKLKDITSANILVVGVGGVGAYAAEMLVRAGIGKITIVDSDIVSESNINRQLLALGSTVGREKTEVLAERLLDINPDLKIKTIKKFISGDDAVEIIKSDTYNYIIDAIDTLTPKIELICAALDAGVPLVSSMGAGSKLDPTLIEVADISKSHHCPLAHALRKRLHKIGIRKGFKVVFSSEPPMEGTMILCNEQNKKSNVGTISYLPAVFGCACSSVVIRDLVM